MSNTATQIDGFLRVRLAHRSWLLDHRIKPPLVMDNYTQARPTCLTRIRRYSKRWTDLGRFFRSATPKDNPERECVVQC